MNINQPTIRPCGTRSIPDNAFVARLKRSKLVRGFLPVLIALGMSGPLQGVPLWDINFSGDTVGQPPSTSSATAGVVNTQPTSVVQGGGGNSTLVQESFTAGSATLADKPVVITYQSLASSAPSMDLLGNIDDFEAPAFYRLSFDFLIDGAASPGTGLMLRVDLLNHDNTMMGRAFFSGDGTLRMDTVGVNNQQFSGRWEKDTVMSAELIFQPFSNRFTVNLEGASGGPSSDMVTMIGGELSDHGVRRVNFRTGSSNVAWTGAVDNIVAIPEPRFAGALLGLGVLLLASRRALRRRRC